MRGAREAGGAERVLWGQVVIDTVAAFIRPAQLIPDSAFQGGSLQMDFTTRAVVARLWHNPRDGVYEPRVTYWRRAADRENWQPELEDRRLDDSDMQREELGETGLLRVEFSVPKMYADEYGYETLYHNLSMDQNCEALGMVDAWIQARFGPLPSIMLWRCQRIDYAWMWPVGELLPAYMSVLHKLRIAGWTRHPYDTVEGVVWKSGSRWVKFYNKALQQGMTDPSRYVLRFEVSNYRDAVRNMAKSWGVKERCVHEFVDELRAVYVLASKWDRLGLTDAPYGAKELEMYQIARAFGERAGQAHYVLTLHREYGNEAWKEPHSLCTRSMYYRYRDELVREGLLAARGDDIPRALPALRLPVQEVLKKGQNLGFLKTHSAGGAPEISEKFWGQVAEVMRVGKSQQSRTVLREIELMQGEVCASL